MEKRTTGDYDVKNLSKLHTIYMYGELLRIIAILVVRIIFNGLIDKGKHSSIQFVTDVCCDIYGCTFVGAQPVHVASTLDVLSLFTVTLSWGPCVQHLM